MSVSRKIGNKGVLKVQVAESDMKLVSGRQTSFGYDYKLGKSTKVFFFFTDLSGNKESKEKEISALGIEYNF